MVMMSTVVKKVEMLVCVIVVGSVTTLVIRLVETVVDVTPSPVTVDVIKLVSMLVCVAVLNCVVVTGLAVSVTVTLSVIRLVMTELSTRVVVMS